MRRGCKTSVATYLAADEDEDEDEGTPKEDEDEVGRR
jgi:hypothetical protein